MTVAARYTACIYGTACGIATASEAAEVLQNTCEVGAVPHRVDRRPHMRVPVNARVPCARSVTPVYAEKSGARDCNSGECAGVAAEGSLYCVSLWYIMQGHCWRRRAAECSKTHVLWGLYPTEWTCVHTCVFLCMHACQVHEVWQTCATKVCGEKLL